MMKRASTMKAMRKVHLIVKTDIQQLNHKDFTSADLKEEEILSIDPKIAATGSTNDRRLKRNSNSVEAESKLGMVNQPSKEENENDSDDNSDERVNL
jgi:hypothetical protein